MAIPLQTTLVPYGEKSNKFNIIDFKRWQQKMFYLSILNLARFVTEYPLVIRGENNREWITTLDARKHSNFLYKNYILNGLGNILHSVYGDMKFAKELWESLEKKYKMEDAGMKIFIVGKFLDYNMIDSKTIISQVHELQFFYMTYISKIWSWVNHFKLMLSLRNSIIYGEISKTMSSTKRWTWKNLLSN